MSDLYEVERIERDGFTAIIYADLHAESPDAWENEDVFLMAGHRDFSVREDELYEENLRDLKKTHHLFPLEAYIHSGIRLALSNEGKFPDRQWDVSQLGVVDGAKEYWKTKKSAKNMALGLIEEWNQYLSGDVYGYQIQTPDGTGDTLEGSCWGIYGLEHAIEEATNGLEYVMRDTQQRKEKKLKEQIKAGAPLYARG